MPVFAITGVQQKYHACDEIKQTMLKDIEKIIVDLNVSLEGNSFYVHQTLQLYHALYTKQLNLFWCGMQANTKICEIGFNAGHSAMLFLMGRDKTPIDFTIFDIGHHSYTKPCITYLKDKFPHVAFEYIEGDSALTMPRWTTQDNVNTYDLIHVDGGHSEYCISHDINNADILIRKGGIIIIDDTNMNHINVHVDRMILERGYIELEVLLTQCYPHRILQKI
jgi:hypothetical protein